MTDAQILETLQNVLKDAVAASANATLPIAFVDINFEVPDDQKYVECVFLPDNIDNLCWGNERVFAGSFRMILHWPKNGEGPYIPMALIDEIASFFKKDVLYDGVQIVSVPNCGPPLAADAENLYPATIRYSNLAH